MASSDNGNVWGVNRQENIYRWLGSSWQHIVGKAIQVRYVIFLVLSLALSEVYHIYHLLNLALSYYQYTYTIQVRYIIFLTLLHLVVLALRYHLLNLALSYYQYTYNKKVSSSYPCFEG